MTNRVLRIEGMTCQHCVAAVSKALQAVPGVISAAVSLAEAQAVVEGDADVKALVAAVRAEGYGATAPS